jgi:hypothetical protein
VFVLITVAFADSEAKNATPKTGPSTFVRVIPIAPQVAFRASGSGEWPAVFVARTRPRLRPHATNPNGAGAEDGGFIPKIRPSQLCQLLPSPLKSHVPLQDQCDVAALSELFDAYETLVLLVELTTSIP